MDKTYKFRLYPTAVQAERIEKTFGCCRFVYNHFLDLYEKEYKPRGAKMDVYQCYGELKAMKHELSWLGNVNVNARALVNSVDELFAKLSKPNKPPSKGGKPQNSEHPRYKTKKSIKQSYQPNLNDVKILEDKKVAIPSIGRVKARITRELEGEIASANVTRAASGYYIIIRCTGVNPKRMPTVGNFGKITAPRPDPGNPKKLERLHYKLSRKTIGSGNWQKFRLKIARENEHQLNREKDTYHKLSTSVMKGNDIVSVNGKLPLFLYNMLVYKAKWYGRKLQ